MDPIQVSLATKGDLAEVLALLRRCKLLEGGVPEAIESFWVARSSQSLWGCAGLEAYGAFGLMRSVAVEESARRAGLGQRLVDCVAAAARERGLTHLFLLTTTAPGFFQGRGFHPIDRAAVPVLVAESWEFRVGCPQAAVAMRLGLREH